MKVTLTRPKPIDVVKELNLLGVSKTNRTHFPDVTMFPQVISLDYQDVWEQFLTTQVSRDLYTLGDFPEHGLYLVCCGFISYLENQASGIYTSNAFNLLQNSKRELAARMVGFKNDLDLYLKRKNVQRNLYPYKEDIQIVDTEVNNFINANVDFKVQITLFMVPRKKFSLKQTDFGPKAERTALDPILYSLKNYLYRNELPKQLKGKKRNLNQNLSRTRYLTEAEVLKIPNHKWARLDTNDVHLLAYRAGADMLALRFVIDVPIVFFGGSLRQRDVLAEIKKVIKRNLPV